MTGIADLYLVLRKPHSPDARARLKALFQKHKYDQTRFVVLSWKRTGSNLLCGILHHHPEITMHNDLFNPIDIFTYYPKALERNEKGDRWTVLLRDLWPEAFLDHIWSGAYSSTGEKIKPDFKAVGFKSFPDHWMEVRNEHIWQAKIMEDFRIKKIILHRQDELAVFVSMKRAEYSGHYMTLNYPKDLKIHVDPAQFQVFVDNYRETYRREYKSPMEKRDTFRVTYEQLLDEQNFQTNILPLLWDFLGVDNTQRLHKLKETVQQVEKGEDLSQVIDNYEELEFCFRHTDVLHFKEGRKKKKNIPQVGEPPNKITDSPSSLLDVEDKVSSWSILLPICSRGKPRDSKSAAEQQELAEKFNSNRLVDLATSSQYESCEVLEDNAYWDMLSRFAESLRMTSDGSQLEETECIVGIDVDDPVFQPDLSKTRIRVLLPCKVVFVAIQPEMYGRVCKIWNHLGRKATKDFVVLLGDDVVLLDNGWQRRIARRFHDTALRTSLPLGAACVALVDETFPGFPTFPVIHRWHISQFRSLLPKQFVNQGGDPYLYELYSRFNASSFEVSCRLKNTVGGDGQARYKKYEINWRGQILRLHLMQLSEYLKGIEPKGICLDVVVPSFRLNNDTILKSIMNLRSTANAYVRFWIVVDRPLKEHIDNVKRLAQQANQSHQNSCLNGNYFVNVVDYGENRGASYARNVGYNYSTADWTLFLDDDVIPEETILDAYIGAIRRYPDAKVFVGLTELPPSINFWTDMLRTCNIMFFYGVSKVTAHPPWGVTANLMVRGSRHNPTIQFSHVYPKTGGGEDIDFVFQFKRWYCKDSSSSSSRSKIVVSVPSAKVLHPWWQNGDTCYDQINGWAWGDSQCITQWPLKTYLVFPNWMEYIVFVVIPLSLWMCKSISCVVATVIAIALTEHFFLAFGYFGHAQQVVAARALRRLKTPHDDETAATVRFGSQMLQAAFLALCAGSIHSAQEVTRVLALLYHFSFFSSICRRMDWNDGQQPRFILDAQLKSFLEWLVFMGWTIWFFASSSDAMAPETFLTK